MKRNHLRRYALANGTSLAERPDGHFTWNPEERVVSVAIAQGIATLSSTDDPPERLGQFPVADGIGKAVASKKSSAPPAREAAPPEGRWATLNEFFDLVAPHLTTTEQAVWVYLFRWCRDGKSSASTRGMAYGVNVTPKTVTAALRWLKDRGLVWEIAKSKHKGSASLYGVHPHPGRFVQLCETANRARLSRRQRETPTRKKPR